jgi:hypothetical protein
VQSRTQFPRIPVFFYKLGRNRIFIHKIRYLLKPNALTKVLRKQHCQNRAGFVR